MEYCFRSMSVKMVVDVGIVPTWDHNDVGQSTYIEDVPNKMCDFTRFHDENGLES